jgi:DNA-binding NtrC family response regulator
MSPSSKDAQRARILLVEDSSVFREMQVLLLGQAGFAVSGHENPNSALAAAKRQKFDLVVIDYELPEMNGHEFMHALRAIQPAIAVIFVSGSLTLELAIQLSSEGVAGIFNKPANPKTLLEKINETLFRHTRDTTVRGGSSSPLPAARRGNSNSPFSATPYVPPEPSADQLAYVPRYVLGESVAFREFTHRLWKVRDFRAVLLLQGETGSPFELFAQDLAEVSIFRDGPVMLCDAGQFEPRGLIEALAPSLLSHDAGTLIVTGVESFTAAQQKTLQDLLAGRDVFLPFARRFRLILAATNDLSARVDDGTFGETLFYKISALTLGLPSLREMSGDIAVNAGRVLESLRACELSHAPATLHPDAAAWLEVQHWPGNYAELANFVRRATEHASGAELTVADLEAAWGSQAHERRAGPAAVTEEGPVVAVIPAARSYFRPSSSTYEFVDRLGAALDMAGTPAAV